MNKPVFDLCSLGHTYNGIRGSVIRYSSGAGRGEEGVRESERPRRWPGYLSRRSYQIFWYTAYGMLFPHCLSYRKSSYFLRSALSGSLPSSDFNATFGRVVYSFGDSLQKAFTMNGQIFTPLSKGRHFRRFVSLGIVYERSDFNATLGMVVYSFEDSLPSQIRYVPNLLRTVKFYLRIHAEGRCC